MTILSKAFGMSRPGIISLRTAMQIDRKPIGRNTCYIVPQRSFLSASSHFSKVNIKTKKCPRLFHSSNQILDEGQKNKHTQNNEKDELFQELEELSRRLRHHDNLYYTPGLQPIITDAEYDVLARREAEICEQHPHLLKKLEQSSALGNKATRFGGRVGPLLDRTTEESDHVEMPTRLRHLEGSPMMSLDNAMSDDDMMKWMSRVEKIIFEKRKSKDKDVSDINVDIIAEPKMDGLSLSLRYELIHNEEKDTYILKWGATRGDGFEGEDVTEAVLEICGAFNSTIPYSFALPQELFLNGKHPPLNLEIRGEVILPKSVFLKSTSTNSSTFTNARNAASGILRRTKNVSGDEFKILRNSLQFHAYDVALPASNDHLFSSTALDLRKFLSNAGFTTPNPMVVLTNAINVKDDPDQNFGSNRSNLEPLFEYHKNLLSSRSNLDFEIDGAVYKISSIANREMIGTSTRAPKWAVAFKFPSLTGITSIQNIEIQVGRTGALTPVAILDPIDIGGVVVTRASLHNFQYAKRVLGDIENRMKVGEQVVVARAGDVIPQILSKVDIGNNSYETNGYKSETGIDSSHENGTDWISLDAPSKCPACGSDVIFDSIDGGKLLSNTPIGHANELIHNNSNSSINKINDANFIEKEGKVLRCSGPQLLCRPRSVGALVHAFSRSALDINGLSEARIADLMDANILTRPSDLFLILDENATLSGDNTVSKDILNIKNESISMKESIASLPGWGSKSVLNLENSVRAVAENGVSLDRFIFSLGIRHVGTHTSKLISSAYGTVSSFLDDISHAPTILSDDRFSKLSGDDNHESVKGIGPVILDSLLSFSANEALVEGAKELASLLIVHDDETMAYRNEPDRSNIFDDKRNLPLEGKTIVFTGSIQGMPRNKAQELARKMGAKATPTSLSKSTDILVEGEKGGKKVVDARKIGVEVMKSSFFLELVGKSQ